MYRLRILQLLPAQPTQDQEELPSPEVLGFRTSVSGTQRWILQRVVPPAIVSDDEVLPGSVQFGLEDDVWASALLAQIVYASPAPFVQQGGEDELFYVSLDDDSLPPSAFMRSWQYTYPNQPFLDDDPWTLVGAFWLAEELWLTFPPVRYDTGTATLDDEVLANAVNVPVDEDYWSPVFTMTIVNVLQPVATTDTDIWVVFVPPPKSPSKGLPILGAGS